MDSRRRKISILIITSLIISLSILFGCSGSGGMHPENTVFTPAFNADLFIGYLYAPISSTSQAGMVILQQSSPPDGYTAVPGSNIVTENNPETTLVTTNSSGQFVINVSDLNGRAGNDNGKLIIANPPSSGEFRNCASISHRIYQWSEESEITRLILHPNARNIYVGEVIQLYAKAVLVDGNCRYIPSNQVTWQVSNENIASISSTGVLTGISEGEVDVTITSGNLTCTGKAHIKAREAATYSLSGTVADSNGVAVENAVVCILGMDVVSVTNNAGRYIIPGLFADTDLTVMVYYRGVFQYSEIIRLTSDTTLNITIPPDAPQNGSIQGTITSDGTLLSGVLVSAGDFSTTTDSNGQYSIIGVPPGTYKFTFTKSAYVSIELYREIAAAQTAPLDVIMTQAASVTSGTLNGRVVDYLGNGISGASVEYSTRIRFPGRGAATTDSNGYFSFPNVPAGSYRIQAEKAGYSIGCLDIAVNVGQETNARITLHQLLSIQIDPTNPSAPKGLTKQFTATGIFSNNTTRDITTEVNWSSSTETTATISNSGITKGVASAINIGTSTITATDPVTGKNAFTTLTVTAAELVSIQADPTNPTIAKGTTRQFTATGTYTDNTTQDITGQVTWSSFNESAATISNLTETKGLASGINTGSADITASLGGITSLASTLTVTNAALVSLQVTPTSFTIAKGYTKQFMANGTFTDGTSQDLTSVVTWYSSDEAAAGISNTSGTKGLATSVNAGSTNITAQLGAITSPTAVLTVTSAVLVSIQVSPTNQSIAKGLTKQFNATGTYSDTTTQDLTTQVTWNSGNPSVASISNTAGTKGLATSINNGISNITATSGAITSPTSILTVTAAQLSSIQITPSNPSIVLGATTQFTATGTYTDSSTQDITTSVTWNSSNSGIAAISNASGTKGLATAVEIGTSQITAILGSVTSPISVINSKSGYQFACKWGTNGTSDGQFDHPIGATVDSAGNVYVTDAYNDRVQKFSSGGSFITKWGTDGSGDGQFKEPYGIFADLFGNIYVTDFWNNRIQKFDTNGSFVLKWGTNGSADGQFQFPFGVALDSSGNSLYASDMSNFRLQKFNSIGTIVTKWGANGSGDGQFSTSCGVAVDSLGNVYVADNNNNRIQKFDSSGSFITKWGVYGTANGQFKCPNGIAVDSLDNVFVVDCNNCRIQKFNSNGLFITKWGSNGSSDGQFNNPSGIAVDSSGNVYVVDTYNHRIQKFIPDP